jgi:thiopeptide-type bacteriocin biosynthesis protein
MVTPPIRPASADAPVTGDGWLAVYVFYVGNARPLLTECVQPLFDGLHADGLISNHFFINYWLEGPHARIRFKLASDSARDLVRARAEEAIGAFLRRRPSLYAVKSDFYGSMYDTLFDLEYRGEERAQYSDENGKMRLRPNNTFYWALYEPEYDKYGGVTGVGLAEWHFRHSSDIVLNAVSTLNLHTRTVLFGYAAQLMMVMCSTFFDDEETLGFLRSYRDYWHSAFVGTDLISGQNFERDDPAMADAIVSRFATIRSAIRAGEGTRLPGTIGAWAGHCAELRQRVTRLTGDGMLAFRPWNGRGEPAVADDLEQVLLRLVPSYVHMTNNRLQVTIADETYLAHVMARALGDESGEPAPAERRAG